MAKVAFIHHFYIILRGKYWRFQYLLDFVAVFTNISIANLTIFDANISYQYEKRNRENYTTKVNELTKNRKLKRKTSHLTHRILLERVILVCHFFT